MVGRGRYFFIFSQRRGGAKGNEALLRGAGLQCLFIVRVLC